MPPRSDQPKESSAAHANVEAATATVVRLFCFMAFLRYLLAPFLNDVPSRWRTFAIDQELPESLDAASSFGRY
jgi:hypothetical protein